MAGRKLNGQQRNALFTLSGRQATDLRALASSGVSEAEMEDLASDGYVTVTSVGHRRAWKITRKGQAWVTKNLP